MKDDIEKVDDKLKVLEVSISRINDSAIRIDSSLKTKRKEIQRLDTINNDLQRVSCKKNFSSKEIWKDVFFLFTTYEEIPSLKISYKNSN